MYENMSLLVLLLIMICYSNASLDELENRMNVKFQNMASLLREQNEKIRNLENIVNVQKEDINVLTDKLRIVKIENLENENEIVKMKETISKLLQKCNDQKAGNDVDTNEVIDDGMAIVERKNNGMLLICFTN